MLQPRHTDIKAMLQPQYTDRKAMLQPHNSIYKALLQPHCNVARLYPYAYRRHCCSLAFINMLSLGHFFSCNRLCSYPGHTINSNLQSSARPSLSDGSLSLSLSLSQCGAPLISLILALTICKTLTMRFGSVMTCKLRRIFSDA
jgi:hypothetical protein